MDLLAPVAIVISVLLAINVGGNNAASAMGPSFGAGSRSGLQSALLIGIFSLLGAVLFGDKVVGTIGGGITSGAAMEGNSAVAILILLAAGGVVALANFLRAPLATSHAMVGAVVGVGVFVGDLHWDKLFQIVVWWILSPIFALVVSFIVGRYFYDPMRQKQKESKLGDDALLFKLLVLISGCFLAFSAGSNSLAKAVGPLVGTGVVSSGAAALIGGVGIALGAIVIGPRIIETVGKGITQFDPFKALLVETLSAVIILLASCYGIPVSLAEIVTCSVIGFSCARSGIRFTARNKHVKVMAKLWPVSPIVTATATFAGCALLSWLHSFDADGIYISLTRLPWN